LWFLMQVNLGEVASADVATLLPKAGMLYFFFHWHAADEPDAPDAGVVLFHSSAEQGIRRVEAPADMHPAGRCSGILNSFRRTNSPRETCYCSRCLRIVRVGFLAWVRIQKPECDLKAHSFGNVLAVLEDQ
jgi:hypothetical protein